MFFPHYPNHHLKMAAIRCPKQEKDPSVPLDTVNVHGIRESPDWGLKGTHVRTPALPLPLILFEVRFFHCSNGNQNTSGD